MILKNHANAPVTKERPSPASKVRRETSQNRLMKKSGMPDRVESLREVDRIKNRSKAWPPGFVKPIRNDLKIRI